jgi:VanZ family protein
MPAALSMIILGVLLEIGQYFIPGRTFSLMDIAANSLGVILGIILGHYLRPGIISQRSHLFPGS